MSKALLRMIEAELAERSSMTDDLFEAQRRFINDPARFKMVTTGRRAGKSHACVVATILDMLQHAESQSYFIAKSINAAKAISLPMFSELNEKYGLGLSIREARNLVRYPNGSLTHVLGADASEALQAIRGVKNFRRCTIDEAGHIRLDVERYVQSVLRPALADCRGTLVLSTTPAEHKSSYTWRIVKESLPGWSLHQWDASANPHTTEQVTEEIANILRETPAASESAWFRREWLGQWVFDESSSVYRYDAACEISTHALEDSDRVVIGVDFGFSPASTALVTLAWNERSPKCVVMEAIKSDQWTIGDIAHQIRSLCARYPRAQVVGDHSAKAVFGELQKRYRVPIMPSYKMQKHAMIELFNVDLESGNIHFVSNATRALTDEMKNLTWVPRGDDRIEDPGAPADCCDALLYAYRLSRHFAANPQPERKRKDINELLDDAAEADWKKANQPPRREY